MIHGKVLPLLLSLSLFLPFSSAIFMEYIGAQYNGVSFNDVPINPNINVHLILAFAIDYTTGSSPTPTNGVFNIFWDSDTFTPNAVLAIKSQHPKVKVAVSLGGDSVSGKNANFQPTSVNSWVSNAVSSLTGIIQKYHLDGIDIDYEHFQSDPNTFAQCIGQLISRLKSSGVITFASIAPFDDPTVQRNYQALWNQFGSQISFVNFQFYAYDRSTTKSQFLSYYKTQQSNYNGGKIIASMISDGSGGLTPANGFFDACQTLKNQGSLPGIFIWCADVSKDANNGFTYEKQAQTLLAS